MELDKFIENYLPEYQFKIDCHYRGYGAEKEDDKWYWCEFIEKYFPAAFENFKKEFADKICKEQKEQCIKSFENKMSSFNDEVYYSRRLISECILNAPQPKI